MALHPELLIANDLPQLAALERESQPHPWTEAQLRQAFDDERARVWGAYGHAELLGFAVFYRLPFDAELQAITVVPQARRRGIAAALLDVGVAQAKRWGSERLLLEVRASNQAAIGLYVKAGFTHDGVRRGYYRDREGEEDALLMSLALDAGKA